MPTSYSRCPQCKKRIAGAGLCADCNHDRYITRKKVYASKLWRTWLRPLVLSEEPVCRACGAAFPDQVDHIKPLSTYPGLAYERSNLQALCRLVNVTVRRLVQSPRFDASL